MRTHTLAIGYDVTLHRDVDDALWFAVSNWQRNGVENC